MSPTKLKVKNLIKYFVLLIICIGCKTPKANRGININYEDYNFKANRQYSKNKVTFSGKIRAESISELHSFIDSISFDFDQKKVLLINFHLNAPNCILVNPKYISGKSTVFKNTYKISNRLVAKHNIQQLFAFSKDAPFSNYLASENHWILDNGIIEKTFFKSSQMCSGFVIFEPDGSFYAHYGEDYFSIVKAYLEAEEIN